MGIFRFTIFLNWKKGGNFSTYRSLHPAGTIGTPRPACRVAPPIQDRSQRSRGGDENGLLDGGNVRQIHLVDNFMKDIKNKLYFVQS